MTASFNRRLGRELVTHLDTAKDLIDQAIEALSDGHYEKSLQLWRRARASCSESRHELAHTWFESCELAIARLEQTCKGDPEAVDLQPCYSPDLGQAAVKARAQERAAEAALEAAKRAKVAEYNRRRHGAEIAELERVIGLIRPQCGLRAIVERLRGDLLAGLQRGITPEQWKNFRDACRRERVI